MSATILLMTISSQLMLSKAQVTSITGVWSDDFAFHNNGKTTGVTGWDLYTTKDYFDPENPITLGDNNQQYHGPIQRIYSGNIGKQNHFRRTFQCGEPGLYDIALNFNYAYCGSTGGWFAACNDGSCNYNDRVGLYQGGTTFGDQAFITNSNCTFGDWKYYTISKPTFKTDVVYNTDFSVSFRINIDKYPAATLVTWYDLTIECVSKPTSAPTQSPSTSYPTQLTMSPTPAPTRAPSTPSPTATPTVATPIIIDNYDGISQYYLTFLLKQMDSCSSLISNVEISENGVFRSYDNTFSQWIGGGQYAPRYDFDYVIPTEFDDILPITVRISFNTSDVFTLTDIITDLSSSSEFTSTLSCNGVSSGSASALVNDKKVINDGHDVHQSDSDKDNFSINSFMHKYKIPLMVGILVCFVVALICIVIGIKVYGGKRMKEIENNIGQTEMTTTATAEV